MPSWAWHCVVEIGATSVLLRTGWPVAGTGRAEVRCPAGAAAVTAGAAAVTAGAESDSAATPPTAATGRTARLPIRASADRPRGVARPPAAVRYACLRKNTVNSAPLTTASPGPGRHGRMTCA